MKELTPADVADYIEEHGHCQNGDFADSEGRVCVSGAARVLCFGTAFPNFLSERSTDGFTALMKQIRAKMKPAGIDQTLISWSDQTETEDLLKQLRA